MTSDPNFWGLGLATVAALVLGHVVGLTWWTALLAPIIGIALAEFVKRALAHRSRS